jgi:hypothetical protein
MVCCLRKSSVRLASRALLGRDRLAGALLVDEVDQSGFVLVLELPRFKAPWREHQNTRPLTGRGPARPTTWRVCSEIKLGLLSYRRRRRRFTYACSARVQPKNPAFIFQRQFITPSSTRVRLPVLRGTNRRPAYWCGNRNPFAHSR